MTNWLKKNLDWLTICLLLPLTVIKTPFYVHNQNTYFVKGFFKAGFLQNDWLANCRSTTTEFDAFVEAIVRFLPTYAELIFGLTHLACFFIFLFFLFKLVNLYSTKEVARLTIVIASLLCFSGLFAPLLNYLGLPESIWKISYSGLAGHGMMSYLKPSIIGVLLFPALYHAGKKNYLMSSVLLMLTALVHSSYLLFSALLAAYLLFELYRNKNTKELVYSFAIMAVFGLLILWQIKDFIFSSDPTLAKEAQRIIIEERSPHHHIISQWIKNPGDWIRIIWLLLGIWVIPGRLKKIYLTIAGGAFVLTLIQFFTNSYTLSLASPWRLSVVLIPLVSVFFVFRLLQWLSSFISVKTLWGCTVILVVTTAIVKYQGQDASLRSPKIDALTELDGRLLIPPKGNWGEKSENVRLNYLIPIFVDHKSNPYAPEEVIEWDKRIKLANEFYENPTQNNLSLITKKETINYVIWPDYLKVEPLFKFKIKRPSEGFTIYQLTE